MSKRRYGRWRGRPNPPPLNWDTPGKPAIREVAGSLGVFRPVRSDRSAEFQPLVRSKPPAESESQDNKQGDSDSVAVSLTNGHWICILQALYCYGQMHGDKRWRKWHIRVRSAILGVVKSNRDDKQPVAVKLPIEDWRTIWLHVRTASQELGDEWTTWFEWLSHTMIAQIKSD